jgi:HEAT repeat protein
MALTAMLEYGERVECMACIPKLEAKLLESSDASVREIAAWWLRRRPFGYARAAVRMRQTLEQDESPVRRVRAAEALGEFLDAGGVPALEAAVASDDEVEVRVAAVRALGRMNARSGQPALVSAFADDSVNVRRAAIDQVLRVSFFDDHVAIVERLEDDDAHVRQRAAQLVGELRIDSGRDALEDALSGDSSTAVRQAAAWSLGKLGGARSALTAARDAEDEPRVLDAIAIALRMQR